MEASQNHVCELSVNESETYKLDFPWNTHGLKTLTGKELGKSSLTIFSKTPLICTNDQETHWELDEFLWVYLDGKKYQNGRIEMGVIRVERKGEEENQSSSMKQAYFMVQWRMYLNGYWNETQ